MKAKVLTGLESFVQKPLPGLNDKKLGLLCNPASVDSRFQHARQIIENRMPRRLTALYSPQHGFFADKQDNMIESDHMVDPLLNLPVFSLYGETRIPTQNMLEPVDVLIVDLQDVGTRVYTFIYTMSYCLEAAAKYGKQVLVLDRPNPISGSIVEGNCLSEKYRSFVGRYPIPMRHGLTIGELAMMFNDHFSIGCDLQVIPMKGWRRKMFFSDTGLPWVAPSPNLPSPISAMVYPGQVLLEGTNVSEGRGTTQPFEICGAPFIDPYRIASDLTSKNIQGIVLRPHCFEPTSGKWQHQFCHGFQIHVVHPETCRPYQTTLELVQSIIRHHKDAFEWKMPPYEYEHERLPIDLITGDSKIRRDLDGLREITDMALEWQDDIETFRELSRKYHLYGD